VTAKINFFGEELNSYKANLHTHSTTSDGSYSMLEVVEFHPVGPRGIMLHLLALNVPDM
jgi:hypothetical protein